MMKASRCHVQFLGVLLVSLFLIYAPRAWSQVCEKCDGVIADSTRSHPAISEEYETFALFLFPSDQWLAKNRPDIAVLRKSFERFGDAIGIKHLAVWLFEDDLKKKIDTDRAKQFCAKFGCSDNSGLNIILTTANPDRWQKDQDEVMRLSFKGISAGRASEVLVVLAEDLLRYRQGNPLPDRVKWATIFEVLRGAINIRKLKEEIVVAFRKP